MTHKALRTGCTLLFCIVTSSTSMAAVAAVPNDNPRHSTLDIAVDKAADDYFRNRCHTGLSVAIVEEEHAYFYDYGSTSRSKAELATSQSVYELASVTKTFTAALAAQAVDEGRMNLDGDFRGDLPGHYSNLALDGKPITLRTLVTHYSGMPRDIPDSDAIYTNKNYITLPDQMVALNKGFGGDQFLAALHNTKLRSEPGKTLAYSNAGFKVISLGLENVYGVPFDRLLHQRITQRLGMTSTVFALDSAEQSRLVSGYDRYGRLMPHSLQNAGAAWGLYSSTSDMAKYLRWQLDSNDAGIRLSHQPMVDTAEDGGAMAWNLGTDNGQPMIWHGGGSFGMSSQMVLYPKQHEGFVMLANDTCEGTESALKGIAMAIYGRSLSANSSP
jgi:serine-type D-Ala-D-Ala carboxypeptidase/endopeptidase